MTKCEYFLPASQFPMELLQNRVFETIINLSTDIGSLEKADESLFRMFELAFPHATEKELADFTKVQGAILCITALTKEHQNAFALWQKEQDSYKN